MKTFSVEARLEGRRVVVVGACGECAIKVARLVESGADVHVFSEGDVDPRIDALSTEARIAWLRRPLEPDDLVNVMLAYVSPTLDCPSLLTTWEAEGHLLCHLDRPETGSFINPASTQGGTVRFAISTAGRAPALARRFRERLEVLANDPKLEAFVEALAALRERTPSTARRAVLNEHLEGFDLNAELAFPAWFVEGRE